MQFVKTIICPMMSLKLKATIWFNLIFVGFWYLCKSNMCLMFQMRGWGGDNISNVKIYPIFVGNCAFLSLKWNTHALHTHPFYTIPSAYNVKFIIPDMLTLQNCLYTPKITIFDLDEKSSKLNIISFIKVI